MTTKTVDWLLVGTGSITRKRVAAALRDARNSRIAAICDCNAESARSLASEYGVAHVYSDFDQALSECDANAVYVATPVHLHVPMARSAVKAGRHVLVEKPLALTGKDALALAGEASKAGVTAGCAYYRRCYPRYAMARKMLNGGEFGKVVLVRMTYFSWCAPAAEGPLPWRFRRDRSGGGVLSDMGTHMFDVLIGLFGLPRTVFARTANLVHDYEVEDSAAMVMTLRNEAQAIASFNWNSKTWSHEFEIIGAEAKVKWHPYDGGKVLKTVGRDVAELDLPNAPNVHLPLVEDFVTAVSESRPPCDPLEEAAKTNVLLDAVYASSKRCEEVAVQDGSIGEKA